MKPMSSSSKKIFVERMSLAGMFSLTIFKALDCSGLRRVDRSHWPQRRLIYILLADTGLGLW